MAETGDGRSMRSHLGLPEYRTPLQQCIFGKHRYPPFVTFPALGRASPFAPARMAVLEGLGPLGRAKSER